MIDQQTKNAIIAWVEEHAEEMYADLQAFARIPSVSRADLAADGAPFGPDCRRMLDHAVARAREMGFEASDNGGWYGDAWLGDRDRAVGIIGHLDVVPEGEGWRLPPYSAAREGDFLIGRGVGDNKSACVMGLYCMRLLREIGAPLRRGVRVLMGCSEETGMADMQHMVEEGKQPPVSLVPDSAFSVNYAQKGTLRGEMSIETGRTLLCFEGGEVRNMVPPRARAVLALPAELVRAALDESFDVQSSPEGCVVSARGQAAHAASPQNGVSAILLLASALADADILDAASQKAVRAIGAMCSDYFGGNAGIACEDPESGKTTMVCGVARTENGRISLSLDCRLSIAADPKANEASFTAYAESIGMRVDELASGRPFYMPKDDPRVRLLHDACREMAGYEGEPYTMGGGTYSRVVPNAITFGLAFPGRGERMEVAPGHGGAHQPDEYIYLPMLKDALKVYACAVLALDAYEEGEDA